MQPKTETIYITTDAAGAGSGQFSARKSGIITDVRKLTIQMAETSSGFVTIQKNGGEFLTSLPVAPRMEAKGTVGLYASEFLTIAVAAGPVSTTVTALVYYEELPERDYSPSTVLTFEQPTGIAGPVDNPVLLDSQESYPTPFGSYFTNVLDVRAYNSIAMKVECTGGTYTDTDLIEIDIKWYADPDRQILTFEDQYKIYKTNILGSGAFKLTDAVHGAYLTVDFYDPNGAGRTYDLDFYLYGSYRSVPATWLRTTPAYVVKEQRGANMAAGATLTETCRLAVGRCMASLLSGAAGGARLTINYAGSTMSDVLETTVANTRVTKEIVMPRWQAKMIIVNTSAGIQTIDAHIIQQGYPQ
jgi:hypothetical protein